MNVFVANEQDEPLGTKPLLRLAELVLEAEGLPPDTEVSILLVTPEQITEYNERFMQRQGPTDVLAFPLEGLEPGTPPEQIPNGPPVNLGDVVISPSYVREQAKRANIQFEDEMELIVVHGLLHLLGYDHQEDEDAEVMETRERDLLGVTRRT
ncbi:MAG TPA: rRNA maturation RNase YbeY [Acidimicrobiia bacterium]